MRQDGRRPLQVLAVDDSAVMRSVLRTIFALHASDGDRTLPAMELCGAERDGLDGLDAVRRLAPDVLLLDLEMPRMNGLEVLAKLKVIAPSLPVIMCSAHTERGARSTLDALSLGAKDYVMKPGQQKDFAGALDALMEQLLPKIAVLAGRGVAPPGGSTTAFPLARAAVHPGGAADLVVIGVSTGGPSALEVLLPMLPRNFGAAVMIVQHMPRLFTGALAERLSRLSCLPVRQAMNGVEVRPGEVWLAPGDEHMEITMVGGVGRQGIIKLHQGPPLNSCKPAADYLFRSAAAEYGSRTVALVMTGMGSDGLEGARAVRDAGGAVLAQDEATSAVWGMPGRVAQAGLASALVPLPALAGALMERVGRGAGRNSRSTYHFEEREALHGMF